MVIWMNKILFIPIMLSLLVLSGCEDNNIYIIKSAGNIPGGSCPTDYTCFDVSNVTSNIYTYNVSSSLDNPYILDVSA